MGGVMSVTPSPARKPWAKDASVPENIKMTDTKNRVKRSLNNEFTLTLHKMCMSPHLYPSPRALHRLACTGAGRGQGEGQVPLKMKDHRAIEKPVSLRSDRRMVHASHAFYATIGFLSNPEVNRGHGPGSAGIPAGGKAPIYRQDAGAPRAGSCAACTTSWPRIGTMNR